MAVGGVTGWGSGGAGAGEADGTGEEGGYGSGGVRRAGRVYRREHRGGGGGLGDGCGQEERMAGFA